jgi:hypothetical protein
MVTVMSRCTIYSLLALMAVVMPGWTGDDLLVLMVTVMASLLNASGGIIHAHAPFVREGMGSSVISCFAVIICVMAGLLGEDLGTIAPLTSRRRHSVCAMTMRMLGLITIFGLGTML